MADPTFQLVVTALAPALKAVQALKELVGGDAKAQVAALYDIIASANEGALAAHLRQLAMLDDIQALKAKLAECETWEREKQRYVLQSIPPGVFAYALKESESGGEPPHWICPGCYTKGKKTFLQPNQARMAMERGLECHVCKTLLRVYNAEPKYA